MNHIEVNTTHKTDSEYVELDLDAMKTAAGGFDTISAAFRKHLTNSMRTAKKQRKTFEQFIISFYKVQPEILSDYLPQLREIRESC